MGILMSVGAVIACATFAAIGPLCKRWVQGPPWPRGSDPDRGARQSPAPRCRKPSSWCRCDLRFAYRQPCCSTVPGSRSGACSSGAASSSWSWAARCTCPGGRSRLLWPRVSPGSRRWRCRGPGHRGNNGVGGEMEIDSKSRRPVASAPTAPRRRYKRGVPGPPPPPPAALQRLLLPFTGTLLFFSRMSAGTFIIARGVEFRLADGLNDDALLLPQTTRR